MALRICDLSTEFREGTPVSMRNLKTSPGNIGIQPLKSWEDGGGPRQASPTSRANLLVCTIGGTELWQKCVKSLIPPSYGSPTE